MLRVDRPATVQAFLELAGPYLEAHEAEHNLIFGIAANVASNPELLPEPARFAIARGRDGEVVGAAMQTPPRQVLLSLLGDPAAAAILADAFGDGSVPAVQAAPADAEAFARRWCATHPGLAASRRMAEGIYRLTAIVPPRAVPGRARIAAARDRDLLAGWLADFSMEALGEAMDEPAVFADRWIRHTGGRAMWLWEIEAPGTRAGTAVSMTGVSGPTPHGIRIGPVYTPPDARRRGFAANLVAAASQAQLDAGRRFCFLFTNLANPTSNRVYQSIGYERVLVVDQWVIEVAPPAEVHR